jgi:hypothetical protein
MIVAIKYGRPRTAGCTQDGLYSRYVVAEQRRARSRCLRRLMQRAAKSAGRFEAMSQPRNAGIEMRKMTFFCSFEQVGVRGAVLVHNIIDRVYSYIIFVHTSSYNRSRRDLLLHSHGHRHLLAHGEIHVVLGHRRRKTEDGACASAHAVLESYLWCMSRACLGKRSSCRVGKWRGLGVLFRTVELELGVQRAPNVRLAARKTPPFASRSRPCLGKCRLSINCTTCD